MADITLAIQHMLRAFGANVRADGILGPKTQAAITQAPPAVSRLVESMQSTYAALTPKDLAFIKDEDLTLLIASASKATGCPVSYLRTSVALENIRDDRGGYRTTLTGTFRGLGQFNQVTWNGVSKLGDIGNWPTSAEPNHTGSVKAMCLLYLDNKRAFLAQFPKGRYTDEVAYLYHNQGSYGATSYLRTGILLAPEQSSQALRTLRIARASYASESSNFA